jgi:hypothetical protein
MTLCDAPDAARARKAEGQSYELEYFLWATFLEGSATVSATL